MEKGPELFTYFFEISIRTNISGTIFMVLVFVCIYRATTIIL